jgi:putative component of toxin-antitoxin plasmid stabilization module
MELKATKIMGDRVFLRQTKGIMIIIICNEMKNEDIHVLCGLAKLFPFCGCC